jgi:hypothetical protein
MMTLYRLKHWFMAFRRQLQSLTALFILLGTLVSLWLVATPVAFAGLDDDRYDGNIFALYAGNGSLVPPKVTLAESFQRDKATLLVLYIDDNSECKQYSQLISRLQAFYGRVTDILPVRVDSIPVKPSYDPTEPGYYYQGAVPQTVVFDRAGKVVLNEKGMLPYEQVDDVFRQVFDLLPRSESVELRRRAVNEINAEIVPQ